MLVALAVLALLPRPDDVPEQVDAVIALGGSPGRVTLAREIADDHDAVLVLSAGSIVFGAFQGLRCDVDARCLWPEPMTTAGEARGTAALAQQHGWSTVVVATSRFHVNRSRLLFTQCLDDVAVVGTDSRVLAAEPLRRTVRELAGMAAGLTVARAC